MSCLIIDDFTPSVKLIRVEIHCRDDLIKSEFSSGRGLEASSSEQDINFLSIGELSTLSLKVADKFIIFSHYPLFTRGLVFAYLIIIHYLFRETLGGF